MIDRLLAIVQSFGAWLAWWAQVESGQVAFIQRWGVNDRELTPGIHWKWPIAEVLRVESGRDAPCLLDPQSLRTADGVSLVVQLGCRMQVVDVRRYWLTVDDGRQNIQDIASLELGRAVRAATAEEVYGPKVLQIVSKRLRAAAKAWGMEVSDLEFASCVPARSYRLWQTQTTSAGQE